MIHTYLLVPLTGILEVFESDHLFTTEQIKTTLTSRDGEGQFFTMDFTTDDYVTNFAAWYVNQIGPINERARAAFVEFTGVHAIFTGPVLIFASPTKIASVVAHLSERGS